VKSHSTKELFRQLTYASYIMGKGANLSHGRRQTCKSIVEATLLALLNGQYQQPIHANSTYFP